MTRLTMGSRKLDINGLLLSAEPRVTSVAEAQFSYEVCEGGTGF